MPYILIRGNLASYGHKNPWRVLVSGLKGEDIEQLKRFACGGYCDDSTIVYLQHPCVILSALEVLGYKVVASSSTAVKQDYNEYMWTMRKEFAEPEPSIIIERDNITNFNDTEMETKGDACVKSLAPLPDEEVFAYIAVKGSLHASDCSAFGLEDDEVKALAKKFPGSSQVINGVMIKSNVISVINTLSQLGYKVASSTGETEITWTLQREL